MLPTPAIILGALSWLSLSVAAVSTPPPPPPLPVVTACTSENALVRKEWSSLTLLQRRSFIDAVLCTMQLPSTLPPGLVPASESVYTDFAATHMNYTMSVHFDGNFYSWHRHLLWLFERVLHDRCDYPRDQGLPYWHWALYGGPGGLENSTLFDGSEYSLGGNGLYRPDLGNYPSPGGGEPFPHGTGGGCVTQGPFGNLTITLPFIGTAAFASGTGLPDNWTEPVPHCLDRDLNDIAIRDLLTQDKLDYVLAQPDIAGFQSATDDRTGNRTHGAGHTAVGMTMRDPFSSPQDPAFYLHHAGLDHLWNLWQEGGQGRRDEYNGTDRVFNAGDNQVNASSFVYFGYLGAPITLGEAKDPLAGQYCYRYAEPEQEA